MARHPVGLNSGGLFSPLVRRSSMRFRSVRFSESYSPSACLAHASIVQPSGSTCPSRLHARNSPCVCIRRLGAEILPMESRGTSSNGADQSQIKSVAACQFQHLNQIEMLRRSNEAIGGIGVEVGVHAVTGRVGRQGLPGSCALTMKGAGAAMQMAGHILSALKALTKAVKGFVSAGFVKREELCDLLGECRQRSMQAREGSSPDCWRKEASGAADGFLAERS